ncbi:hypothetical protein AVEN_41330-1 [Araneus ventricosus]|uniref:Uncharacterized protein n=1 Tax=Araneus ventricosus TaxID=182803 RepID=A0A4Y2GUE5_ARAVE|nr:hypothetical protein AVEN_41330-1 [Araneus ventricosus]
MPSSVQITFHFSPSAFFRAPLQQMRLATDSAMEPRYRSRGCSIQTKGCGWKNQSSAENSELSAAEDASDSMEREFIRIQVKRENEEWNTRTKKKNRLHSRNACSKK